MQRILNGEDALGDKDAVRHPIPPRWPLMEGI